MLIIMSQSDIFLFAASHAPPIRPRHGALQMCQQLKFQVGTWEKRRRVNQYIAFIYKILNEHVAVKCN